MTDYLPQAQTTRKRRTIFSESIKSVHLIAVCGTGMTALAGMLKTAGFEVSGSDQNVYPPMSTFLEEIGIDLRIGYKESNLDPEPDLVVIGNAMSRGNPEVEAVLNKKMYYVSLPFILSELFIRGKHSCVVAGTHGKTTTSSLLAWVLESAGRDPSFFIGGIPRNFGKGFKLGKGEFFVSEGDEYDSAFFDKRSKFLHYLPDLVILNNVEFDHADIFDNIVEIETTFSRLIKAIPQKGYLVANHDDARVQKLAAASLSQVVTFGFGAGADWQAVDLQAGPDGTVFEVLHAGRNFNTFRTPLYGKHMVMNCLSVIASCHAMGLNSDEIGQGLRTFENVQRRLQLRGVARGIKIFDDFAHHPTEVSATIQALRSRYPDSRLWAIFEPRTATSKRKIFEQQYVEALAAADNVVLTPMHRLDKVPENERLSLEAVTNGLLKTETPNWVLPATEEMTAFLRKNAVSGDVILFMSNGDFNQIPANLITDINNQRE